MGVLVALVVYNLSRGSILVHAIYAKEALSMLLERKV